MPTDIRLENYLLALDRALGPISISDRAEIVTEIKSHILDAQAKEPERELNSILSSLGEPETVANRYLMERGLKPGKAPKSPMVKWLTIGFLGTFAMLLLGTGILIWKFTPIIKVDDSNNRLILLGGLIDINGSDADFNLKVGSNEIHKKSQRFSGKQVFDKNSKKTILIPFSNGKFDIKTSPDRNLTWDCKYGAEAESSGSKSESEMIRTTSEKFELDFGGVAGVSCDVSVPKGMTIQLNGSNAKIEFDRAQFNVSVKASNGKIDFRPDEKSHYRYDTHIINGVVSGLESSDEPDAYKISLSLTNGKIGRD